MSAAFVKDCETWPEASVLTLEVLNEDGEYGKLYKSTSAEVVLIERQDDHGALVIPLAFHTLERAQRAGKILADALDAVREIQAEKPPRACGMHVHRWRVSRFARGLDPLAVCERCGDVADLLVRKTA